MARAHPLQNNFTAGEFSPRLEGRVDIQRYANAVRTMQNFVALPHGGVRRRSGTHFVAEVKASTSRVRLIPFEFSDTQAYVLEFGDQYMRVYMDGGQVLDGDAPFELATPYLEADLPKLKWVQSADVLYIVHPDYEPRKLTRTGHTAWTLTKVTFLPPPTAEVPLKPNADLTPGATTGAGVTFTASASVFLAADVDRLIVAGTARASIQTVVSGTQVTADIIDDFPSTDPIAAGSWELQGSPNTSLDPTKKEPVGASTTLNTQGGTTNAFRTSDVGKYIKINDGIVKITSRPDATQVKGEIVKVLSSDTAAPAGTWTLEEPAWTSERGFPSAVSFHEGRLVFAGTKAQPQTLWGSKSGDFENFATGVDAGDSYEFGIAANKVNVIRWLLPSRVLLIGTKGGEFRVTGGVDEPIKPTNVDAKSETVYGSNFVPPVRVGSAILFVQRSGRKLRELAFSLDFDAYVAPDLTVLSEHLLPRGKTIYEMDFQQDPDPVLWAVRSDGLMLGMSYDRSNDVVGWHQHPTDGEWESVAVIPHPDGDREQVWVVVKRTINGQTKRYVEFLDDVGGYYGDLQVDCALTYSGAAATTFAGLEHLRGKTVAVLGDGAYYGTFTVPAAGPAEITIDPPAEVVEIGLPFVSRLETLRVEVPLGSGTSQGLKKRVTKLHVRVHNTMGIKINGRQTPARRSTDLLGSAPALFTGDYDGLKLGWDAEGRNVIEQALPFPANILGIFGTIDLAEF